MLTNAAILREYKHEPTESNKDRTGTLRGLSDPPSDPPVNLSIT